jgi:fused signal recognition particle receptor
MLNLSNKTEQGVKRSREAWFSKISRLFDRSSVGDDTWEELEELLIAADVGVATAEELIQRTRKRAREEKLKEGSQVRLALKAEMAELLKVDGNRSFFDSDSRQVILVVGVNGSGKTTSIAKLAHAFNNRGKKVVLAAADTFRAAAIDQLKHWGQKVGVDVVAHQPGGDPGAVVFDALQAAQNRQADVVIIDTAGRLHTKFNLMEELKNVKRVAGKYDINQETLLVLDATTGQNGLAQARHFTKAAGVSGVFLSKLDGTAKGGIVLAICQELKIPILFIGTGEQLDDMAPFDAEAFVEAIFS